MPGALSCSELPLEQPFADIHYDYITLRGEHNLSNLQMAKELGIHRNTVGVWNNHRPFQEAVETKWLATARSNEALAHVVKNRCLVELERRTRGKQLESTKTWSLYALTEAIKTLRKELEGGTSFSLAIDLGGLTPQRADDIHSGETKKIEGVENLRDESNHTGSLIARLKSGWQVPFTSSPGEIGSQN